MTKQQIIDQLNALTDDPNEEIFGYWDDHFWEIHDITIQTHTIYKTTECPKYPDPAFQYKAPEIVASSEKICIDCS